MAAHVADGVDVDTGNSVGVLTGGVNGVPDSGDSGDGAASSGLGGVVNPANTLQALILLD